MKLLWTRWGRFNTRIYRGADGSVGVAIWQGVVSGSDAVLGRVHSSCFTSEGLGAIDCDCAEQLDMAFRAVASRRSGIVFYLLQEGRGAGLLSKARDRMVVQRSGGAIDTFAAYRQFGLDPDPRRYELVSAICADLGIGSIHLMTNNPLKIDGLTAAGLRVKAVQLAPVPSRYNSEYLKAKARNGHRLAIPVVDTAEPAQDLERADPRIDRFGRFVRVASYNVPIQVDRQTTWFRASAYSDESGGYERLVLSHSVKPNATPVLQVFRDQLFDRLSGTARQLSEYRHALQRIVEHGAGSILAIPDDASWFGKTSGPKPEEDMQLLRYHSQALSGCAGGLDSLQMCMVGPLEA